MSDAKPRLVRRRPMLMIIVVAAAVAGCATTPSPGMLMMEQRRTFERKFIPALDQYEKFSDAAGVYVSTVRRIAQEVGWQLTDLDELGLLYVEAMAEYVDRGELSRKDALFRMRLMEKWIMDEYTRRYRVRRQDFLNAMSFWALWQQSFALQRLHEPVTCFQSGSIITCR